jgi:hypothetical protein
MEISFGPGSAGVAAKPKWWTKLFKFHFESNASSSKISEFDCLPKDKITSYKNRPDLQWFYMRAI